jgi:TolA-binding protein
VDRIGAKPVVFTRPRAVALAVALMVVAVFGWVTLRPGSPASLAYTVVGDASGDPGTYLAPIGTEPVVLRFAEGSRITLDPSSRARIAQTTPKGATLVLEAGTAHLEIEPHPEASWRVVSGPYSVTVRGTAFTVGWDAATGTFEVSMRRGAVLVQGPGIDQGVELSGEQHFLVRDPRHKAPSPPEVPSAAPGPSGSSEALPRSAVSTREASPSVPSATAAVSEPMPGSASSEPVAKAPETWSALAARGQFARVVQEADTRGVDAVLQGADLGDLWAFADAARVTGRGADARRALLAVRGRFAGSARAASAAFLLGRMSDDGGSPGAAIPWYDRYLSEAPGGSFAPEAHGRRMVAWKRSGNQEAARRAAEAYLKQFPSGPYAAVARDMVGD